MLDILTIIKLVYCFDAVLLFITFTPLKISIRCAYETSTKLPVTV